VLDSGRAFDWVIVAFMIIVAAVSVFWVLAGYLVS
jgi:hypothetical protein